MIDGALSRVCDTNAAMPGSSGLASSQREQIWQRPRRQQATRQSSAN